VPRESLDAPDDLPKQALCQVALGQLQGEVPGMPDEAPAGFAEPPQKIAEIVRDDPEEQAHLVGPGTGGTRAGSSGWRLCPP
jgi:hypothetical protein